MNAVDILIGLVTVFVLFGVILVFIMGEQFIHNDDLIGLIWEILKLSVIGTIYLILVLLGLGAIGHIVRSLF